MNTDLRKAARNDFEKYFFKLINNSDFSKLWILMNKLVYLVLSILDLSKM